MLTLVVTAHDGPDGSLGGVGTGVPGAVGSGGPRGDGQQQLLLLMMIGPQPRRLRPPHPPLTNSSASTSIDSRARAGVVLGMEPPRAAYMPARFACGITGLPPRAAVGRRPEDASRVILRAMNRALLVLALSGCVTGAGVVKKDEGVSLPLLAGAVVAALVVTSLAASQIQSYSLGASVATGLALTAVDTVIGCLVGACAVLRP